MCRAEAPRAPANERNQLKNFKDLGLAEPLLRALNENDYTDPTPIQLKAMSVVRVFRRAEAFS